MEILNNKSKKILIVEDLLETIASLKSELEREGFCVITAADAEEGLNSVSREKPDLVILEIMLPKLNAYELCSLVKLDRKFKNIPVIMFTLKIQDEGEAKRFTKGADEYVTKPFEWEKFLEKIKKYVKKGATILVTDDEINITKALKIRMESEGYRVITASNGLECLNMAEVFHPDLITLDVLMPGMDGFETCCRLRENLKLTIPIIMLTVKDQPEDIAKGLKIGPDVYIARPVDNKELLHHIYRQLKLYDTD